MNQLPPSTEDPTHAAADVPDSVGWDAISGLVIRVVPSAIKDAEGNVVQVIG